MVDRKSVCILGLGYIGLPTAALMASKGFNVVGVDINKEVVNKINKGTSHIDEPGLEHVVRDTVLNKRFKASTHPTIADIYIICVPTPFQNTLSNSTPSPDISHVLSATNSISSLLKPGDTVILESTSPVGTTHKVQEHLEENGVDTSTIHIAYCPERVLPGQIMKELIVNDRIIGGINKDSQLEVGKLYRSFVKGEVFETDAKTAEMCKLTENSFRDVNIAFANELSLICDKESINTYNLIRLANRHPRVNILQPGVGVGGHCIAVDPWFIVSQDPDNAKIIRQAREINDSKTDWVINKIILEAKALSEFTQGNPKIACMGLAFKPNVADLRESPAVKVANRLHSLDDELYVVEPNIKEHYSFNLVSLEEAISKSDIIIFLVKHDEFIQFIRDKNNIKQKCLDFCGIFDEIN